MRKLLVVLMMTSILVFAATVEMYQLSVELDAARIQLYSTLIVKCIEAANENISLYSQTGNTYFLSQAKDSIRQAMNYNDKFYETTNRFFRALLKIIAEAENTRRR